MIDRLGVRGRPQQPDTWRWLLAKRVADEEGRCEACRWASRGAPMWPGTLHFVATEAERIAAERTDGHRRGRE